jgi:hypothetical protein
LAISKLTFAGAEEELLEPPLPPQALKTNVSASIKPVSLVFLEIIDIKKA